MDPNTPEKLPAIPDLPTGKPANLNPLDPANSAPDPLRPVSARIPQTPGALAALSALNSEDPPTPEKLEEMFLNETGALKQELIEIAARDVERSSHQEARLAFEKAQKRETFYSDLIYTLTDLRYEEQEARVLWVNLLTHKMELSDRLGRNVGIRVAALDYFKNILGALEDVKIMDASKYIETAQLAVTDGLTGVFNHRYFQDRLLRDINRVKEEGGVVSLLMIDIDYFKQYNDINGHIAGDVALKEVASVLRRNLKRDDLVARYGGEEFAVILFGLNKEQATLVAERIRRRVEEMDFPNEKVLPGGNLTISIGLAEFPTDATERGELIACADRALFHSKRTGKNKVSLSPSELRHEERVPYYSKVNFRPANEQDPAMQEALSSNLSVGGICMQTPAPINKGQLLYLLVDGMTEEKPVLGQVAWKRDQPGGDAQIGIKFVQLGDKEAEKLKQLLGNQPGEAMK
jgi:diguanylate cyclase (GGDEF)-like protein